MEAGGISLHDLANLAIGTPEVGAVNFTALHTLLHAIIKHLPIQDEGAELTGGRRRCPPSGGTLGQLEALNHLPSGLDLIERSKPGHQEGSGAVEDMWQLMKLKKRLEVNEEGVCKVMTMLQDLMLDVNTLKESQREESSKPLEKPYHDVTTEAEKDSVHIELGLLKAQVKKLQEKFEDFHETLARFPETKEARTTEFGNNDISPVSEPIRSTELSQPDRHMLEASYTEGSSQDEDSMSSVETAHVTRDGVASSILEDTHIEVLGQQHENDLTYTHPGAPVLGNTEINPSKTSMDTTPSPGSPVTPSPSTGATSKEPTMLYITVDDLETDKANRTDLRLLQKNTDDLARNVHDLQEKLNNLIREIQDLRGDPDKTRHLLDRPQRSVDQGRIIQHDNQKLEDSNLNSAIQDIEKELKEMRKSQNQERPSGEQSVTDVPLNLRDEDNHSSVIDDIQSSMLRLQEECERLTTTTGSLLHDQEQKQQHIDILYQAVENLDKNKVDKDLHEPEDDVVSEDQAPKGKMNCTDFNATTENKMLQELLSKVTAQERDWQRLVERISAEMQNKLDRMELEPLKNILEQCWRDLHQQLQGPPVQYEVEEAAGIRKQLIQRFHCISCNRMVDMMVPGSEVLSIPNIPGLPAHRSNRPYTVFELDQIRQQSRSDRFPQLSDFGSMSSTRNCGGSHTLTYPQRRYTRLQASTPCTTQREDLVDNLKEEVYILGQDGHIYRGRRDNHLPTIRSKDAKKATAAHQKVCDCNLKGDDNVFGCSSVMASDIHYGVSKTHLKSTQGSEQPLPSLKDNVPPMCYIKTT
ncbi:hypothetical protein GDO81_012935 [Engystomops pustulosus]|uniref:DUF4795 domain-containing protein n=1 Tax=Engystomops pustulosus TaxID=76066 RepID=A0AAV7B227_ENGPU|nr:hypothetical protein GDO81_012935 [Engystomops pustulosus]